MLLQKGCYIVDFGMDNNPAIIWSCMLLQLRVGNQRSARAAFHCDGTAIGPSTRIESGFKPSK
jgi:hypothetical protein